MAVRTVGIVGAGTMGSGIAQLAAQNGYDVVLRDIEEEYVEAGIDAVEEGLEGAEERGFVDDAAAALDHVTGTVDLEAVTGTCDLIVEAVNEDLELKQSIFGDLDTQTDPDVILGSNTSSISITEIATATDAPERVIGTHFFNPPVKMNLIELITGYETSEDTVAKVETFGESVGHRTVTVEDYPGFATSRLGLVLGMEAARMVQEGVASAEDIDTAMEEGYNLPVGPLKLGDHNGWDVRVEIGEYLYEEFGRPVFKPPQNVKQMVRAGRCGVKSGQGFYDWEED